MQRRNALLCILALWLAAMVVYGMGLRYSGEPVSVGYYAWSDDAQSVIVTLDWHVTCDELNPTFYAENGHLYHRADGSRVEIG